MTIPIKERLGVEALTVVIMNFDSDGIEEYEEIISALHGKGYHEFSPNNLNLDLNNKLLHPIVHPLKSH